MSVGHVERKLCRGLWLLLAFLSMAMPLPARDDEGGDPTSAIDQALKIATSREAGSLKKLQELRLETKDALVRDYLDAMIHRWDEAKNTYVAPRPLIVVRECLAMTEEDRRRTWRATYTAFAIQVGASGHATSVEPLRNPEDAELERRMRASLSSQRFVPLNDEQGPRPGTMTATCRIEVR